VIWGGGEPTEFWISAQRQRRLPVRLSYTAHSFVNLAVAYNAVSAGLEYWYGASKSSHDRLWVILPYDAEAPQERHTDEER
jgi:hypothetical protein